MNASSADSSGGLHPAVDLGASPHQAPDYRVLADAPAFLQLPGGRRVVNDAKLREQLLHAVNNQSELIGSILYLDERVNTPGLSGPLRDLLDGPLAQLLADLKTHQEMISVLTGWAAQAGLEQIPNDETPPSPLSPPPPTLVANSCVAAMSSDVTKTVDSDGSHLAVTMQGHTEGDRVPDETKAVISLEEAVSTSGVTAVSTEQEIAGSTTSQRLSSALLHEDDSNAERRALESAANASILSTDVSHLVVEVAAPAHRHSTNPCPCLCAACARGGAKAGRWQVPSRVKPVADRGLRDGHPAGVKKLSYRAAYCPLLMLLGVSCRFIGEWANLG